jgi:hypothetical protein
MTLLEWRQNPDRRSLAVDVLNNQTVREMLAVMEVEHPAKQPHKVMDGFGATKALGRIEGYQEALQMLHAFAQEIPGAPEQINVTWGVEPTDTK